MERLIKVLKDSSLEAKNNMVGFINNTRHPEVRRAEGSVESNRFFAVAQNDERKSFKRYVAFTLAETLITITILGVVATVLIPNIISNYKKHLIEVKFKFIYSQLSRIIDIMNVQDGTISKIVDESLTQNTEYFNEKYFKKYLKFTKECESLKSDCRIFADSIFPEIDGTTNNKSEYAPYYFHEYLLPNGIILGTLNQYNRISFIVDLNGTKKPNQIGSDIFYFSIYNTEADMRHTNSLGCGAAKNYTDAYTWVKEGYCKKGGGTCSCKIIDNGFKIPEDYPVKKF